MARLRRLGEASESVRVETHDALFDRGLGVILGSAEGSIRLLVAGHLEPPPRVCKTAGRYAHVAAVAPAAVFEFERFAQLGLQLGCSNLIF